MIANLEDALMALKNHEDTGNYTSLYAALGMIIKANKTTPGEVDPLVRGLSNTVLEPLYLQIEKHLQDLHEEQKPAPKEQEELGQVIFVDFARKKRSAA